MYMIIIFRFTNKLDTNTYRLASIHQFGTTYYKVVHLGYGVEYVQSRFFRQHVIVHCHESDTVLKRMNKFYRIHMSIPQRNNLCTRSFFLSTYRSNRSQSIQCRWQKTWQRRFRHPAEHGHHCINFPSLQISSTTTHVFLLAQNPRRF